jgi:tripartite-type tricarboxylate transporter receptor subunit TctC
MSERTRRALLGAGGLCAAALLIAPRPARAFPDRSLRVIVPWNAGGVTDILARAMAPSMQAALGQPVVIENRAGANGGVGAEAAARAAPDGHALFVSNADTHAINPFAYRRLAYDPAADFAPVSLFARVPFAVIAGPSQPRVSALPDLLAAARAAPGRLSFASWGVASASHLSMERVLRAAGGVEMLHVPFTGQAPGMTAVAAGQVDAMVLPAGGAEALARDGRVRVLAVTSAERLLILPAAPTLREAGVDVVTGNWFAFHVPARTPDPVVRRLSAVTAEVLRVPSVVEVFRQQATTPEATSPEGLGEFVREERERWAAVIRAANVQLE